MPEFSKKIAFIGGGNMAEAIITGLLKKQILSSTDILVTDVNPERRKYLKSTYSVETSDSNSQAPKSSSTLLLAVKPQILTAVKDEIKNELSSDHIIVSILAGQSRARLGEALGYLDRIVRVMPNLPAQAGRGISAITFPDSLDEKPRDWVRSILKAAGEIVEVDESLQDAVTAVSGSGPGYLFYLADHWINAAIQQGLSAEVSRLLVTETLAGAAEILRQRPDSPSELVRKVATPGGTTEAGLSVLSDANLQQIIEDTINRATLRSKELNKK